MVVFVLGFWWVCCAGFVVVLMALGLLRAG